MSGPNLAETPHLSGIISYELDNSVPDRRRIGVFVEIAVEPVK
jgi:hypothetical protein